MWIQRKDFNSRQIHYPISKNKFDEHFERALILLEDKEIDFAFEALQGAIGHYHQVNKRKHQIEYQELLDLAGKLALANGNIELAQKYFAEELEIQPNSSAACAGLAEVFLAQELFENAKTMYEWAVKNDPNNKSAIEALKNVNVELGFEPAHTSLEEESV